MERGARQSLVARRLGWCALLLVAGCLHPAPGSPQGGWLVAQGIRYHSASPPLFSRPATLDEGSGGSVEATPLTEAYGVDVPPGWPGLSSSEDVIAPFLKCASPAEFVAMQHGVDMARLLKSLKDWDAVRLGALGPLDAKASEVLNRKRAAFIVTATEKYGVPRAEVFALFVLHSAFDDELRQLLRLLGDNKQLGATMGAMAAVREELQRRGLELSEYPDRAERAGDVLRGLGSAGRDALSSTEASAGARYLDLSAKREQLPPPYQQALDEVEQALMEQHYASGSVALGSFDHLTFGVPLGFYPPGGRSGPRNVLPVPGQVRAGHARARPGGTDGGAVCRWQRHALPL